MPVLDYPQEAPITADDVHPTESGWARSLSAARTSADDAYIRVRDLIHSGDLSPGDQLPPERNLCEMLKISRVTLRGALSALRNDGYLEIRRGGAGGTFISPLEKPYQAWIQSMRAQVRELADIIEMRSGIECQIARLAAERRTGADVDSLRASVARLSDDIDPSEFRQADAAFHTRLAQAARSPRLGRAMLVARGELFVPASTPMIDRPGVVTTRTQHAAILAAVSAGEVEAAEQHMREHLERSRRDIAGLLWPEQAGGADQEVCSGD